MSELPEPQALKAMLFAQLASKFDDVDVALEYVMLLAMPRRIRRRLRKIQKLARKRVAP